ncbi:MOSC domain-containing protein [Altererythrobacter sp. MF3-039]|uniref:MOSC domain-containing protein n=1 Tax=Altererythrobacter sp. MF3-039 TaxID=3252901 RepID=UPI00390C72DD
MNWSVEAICTGLAVPFNGAERSAIAKHPTPGPLRINRDGFEVDEQADRKVHGGPEMAVHLYPLDHHDFWTGMLMGHALLAEPGAFGSNLAVRGIDEEQVCIGDRFQLGSAVLEISQARQPCWKVEHRFQRKGMVAAIIETGRSGWYFRVLEEGVAQAGDTLHRIEQGHEDWSVARVFETIFAPDTSNEDLAAVANLERLSPNHRERARMRLA